jgi:hypothetical protein
MRRPGDADGLLAGREDRLRHTKHVSSSRDRSIVESVRCCELFVFPHG